MIRSCFAAALALVFCGTGVAHAASHAKRASHPAVSSTSSVSPASGRARVDGIVSAVVDDLWAQNDRILAPWGLSAHHRSDDRIIVGADPNFVECYATGGWLMESLGNLTDARRRSIKWECATIPATCRTPTSISRRILLQYAQGLQGGGVDVLRKGDVRAEAYRHQ